ncbi:MAG TPA: tRNA 5-methoxyuridine(34)/uridine 5-oxyacetic acid(34) synthase CmoB [Woeseiaceae bacterium]|nr:tRNA 5-methoxyuridine(34)/uridine 5-oxyacetic acid(34) synthase CmoB [Woeseiaceae bacterium]
MFDFGALYEELAQLGLESWREPLEPLLEQKTADAAHGQLAEWREVLQALPPCEPGTPQLDAPVVSTAPDALSPALREPVRDLLLKLLPWRKGPFSVGGILVDAEWRSDRKWGRLENAISPLAGRLVLDVGCGNGYYALRMRGNGARTVIGLDPMLIHIVQHMAIRHFMPPLPIHLLPLRLHELPQASAFDTVFSMGVLYHQRDPALHLTELRRMLKDGGELVLETLILPGRMPAARTPERYARMKNVWHLPTEPLLLDWLEQAGFAGARTIDVSRTTTDEQRRTDWMPFDSLDAALDPDDPGLTIEGWPAPTRAVIICH